MACIWPHALTRPEIRDISRLPGSEHRSVSEDIKSPVLSVAHTQPTLKALCKRIPLNPAATQRIQLVDNQWQNESRPLPRSQYPHLGRYQGTPAPINKRHATMQRSGPKGGWTRRAGTSKSQVYFGNPSGGTAQKELRGASRGWSPVGRRQTCEVYGLS